MSDAIRLKDRLRMSRPLDHHFIHIHYEFNIYKSHKNILAEVNVIEYIVIIIYTIREGSKSFLIACELRDTVRAGLS